MKMTTIRREWLDDAAVMRFFDKILAGPGCWEWQANKYPSGYGGFWLGNRKEGNQLAAHRVSYTIFNGDIPQGLVIDHMCRNRACVRPDHLRAVTQWENVMASPVAPAALHAAKTHCPSGHPYSGDNLKVYDRPKGPARVCLACRKIHNTNASQRRSNNRKATER